MANNMACGLDTNPLLLSSLKVGGVEKSFLGLLTPLHQGQYEIHLGLIHWRVGGWISYRPRARRARLWSAKRSLIIKEQDYVPVVALIEGGIQINHVLFWSEHPSGLHIEGFYDAFARPIWLREEGFIGLVSVWVRKKRFFSCITLCRLVAQREPWSTFFLPLITLKLKYTSLFLKYLEIFCLLFRKM